MLSPSAIADGVLNQMDTTTLVTLPAYLVVEQAPASVASSGSANRPHTGIRSIEGGASAKWIFGEALDIKSFSLPLTKRMSEGTPANWSLGLMKPDGSITWQTSYQLVQAVHTRSR